MVLISIIAIYQQLHQVDLWLVQTKYKCTWTSVFSVK